MQGLKKRRSIRLAGYDYTRAGAYFITVCTFERRCLFGEIIDGEMILNETGRIVEETWLETPQARGSVELGDFVVMPNHLHGAIILQDNDQRVGASRWLAREVGIKSGSVGAIIAQFKSLVTKRVKNLESSPQSPLWQRNYYEHIIRDEEDLNRIREYVIFNPQKWHEDQDNPSVFQNKNS